MKRFCIFTLILLLAFQLAGCQEVMEGLSGLVEGLSGTSPEEEPYEEDGPKITERIRIVSDHEAVDEEDYHQYSNLSRSERKVYDVICEAIRDGENSVDLQDYECSVKEVCEIYQAVTTDHPEFFFMAKDLAYTYDTETVTVKRLLLAYSDGETADSYDSEGKLDTVADRDEIDRQIEAFNETVTEVVNSIPVEASDVEKERLIYDYIQDHVEYDTDAEELLNEEDAVSLSLCAYGAACEQLAVCEGYAELFQYLCYCVGINATQVCGDSYGGAHMWNAVCIDSRWYMADVTWDDTGCDDFRCYSYFNVTEDRINRDHTIWDNELAVPECTATDAAFFNLYALHILSDSEAPANYETVINNLLKNGDEYLCVYSGNRSGNLQSYISRYVFDRDSEVQEYFRDCGWEVSFGTEYYTSGDYYYLPLTLTEG